MSKWWLFIGFVFLCSGFLMPIGAIIVAWFILDFFSKNKESENATIDTRIDEYSKETIEEMR